MRKVIVHSLRADFRALIVGLLSDMEAEVVATSSRRDFLERCATWQCDLVLTDDVRMFLNDVGTLQKIRQGGRAPSFFIFSYDLSEESVTTLLEMGVDQFITLPVAAERLRKKVEQLRSRVV